MWLKWPFRYLSPFLFCDFHNPEPALLLPLRQGKDCRLCCERFVKASLVSASSEMNTTYLCGPNSRVSQLHTYAPIQTSVSQTFSDFSDICLELIFLWRIQVETYSYYSDEWRGGSTHSNSNPQKPKGFFILLFYSLHFRCCRRHVMQSVFF